MNFKRIHFATGDRPLGSMNKNIKKTQDILLAFDLISASIDLNSIYTNQLQRPNNQDKKDPLRRTK